MAKRFGVTFLDIDSDDEGIYVSLHRIPQRMEKVDLNGNTYTVVDVYNIISEHSHTPTVYRILLEKFK